MKIITEKISISTKGFSDIIDISPQVRTILGKESVQNGNITLFVPGSTAGITTIEYEPGLLKDLPEAFETLVPQNKSYFHDATWGDGNGFSHVRAALLGPSLVVPFENKRLLLGTWQQIVVIDFDNRSRQREVVIQLMGE
jgi:secondary thiamine-phosphate synthase enzyme